MIRRNHHRKNPEQRLIVNLLAKLSTCDIDENCKTKLFCSTNPIAMKLMMYIGNDLIESIPLELGRISKPGYLGSFKRALKVKYNDLILQQGEKPEFLVVEPTISQSKTPEATTRR